MLSGDDMICYLLFPEVSFHCIDKWRKPGHAGVQMTLRVQTQVLPILKHFPVLSVSFSLLFVVVVQFMFGTVTVAEVVVVGLRPCAFHPVSVQRPRRGPAQVALLPRLLLDTRGVPTSSLLGVAAARVCTIVPCIRCTECF